LATFGPVGLDPQSVEWGHILQTPKAGWSNVDLAGPLKQTFGCPIVVDTDVNGAALAESLWGAGRGHDVVLYFTVGTGIGGGAVIHGRTLRGEGHPEMGHIRLPRHPDDMDFAGTCPFHGCCLEGLASGPAILARWGKSLSELEPDHPAHQIIAWYLAHTAVTMQAIFEPGRIIFGGGVMATPGLIERVTQQASQLGGGYFRSDALQTIARPGLGDNAGLLGALAVALSSTS
jgi:fructokinase